LPQANAGEAATRQARAVVRTKTGLLVGVITLDD
jgi:hypothetical protein